MNMKRIIICMALVLSITTERSFGQVINASAGTDSLAGKNTAIMNWLEYLYKEGVSVNGDSVTVSDETRLWLTNEQFRQLMYPKNYSWEMVIAFIKEQDLKKAFWFLFNLYITDAKNKEIVLKAFM